jgi:hypothetical protein
MVPTQPTQTQTPMVQPQMAMMMPPGLASQPQYTFHVPRRIMQPMQPVSMPIYAPVVTDPLKDQRKHPMSGMYQARAGMSCLQQTLSFQNQIVPSQWTLPFIGPKLSLKIHLQYIWKLVRCSVFIADTLKNRQREVFHFIPQKQRIRYGYLHRS